ncbi:WD40 repeat protein, partial [Linderina pennispora]
LFASLVSLEDFMDGGTTSLLDASQTRRMRIRPEFFPVAISADRGMAVGIDQDWTLEEHAVIGLSKLPVRAKLYVHTILDHMLGEGAEQDALMYAGCFEHWRFFPHAMEILLHEVLEREIDTQQQNHNGISDDRVLPRVIRLLENFSQFDEIVVHCARKTEAAFWSTLFDCLGGPARFFRQCLAKQKLETATQCLIILQTLEPSETSARLVLSLLEMAVQRQNRDLCLEILRFLKMTGTTSDPSMHGLLAKLRQPATI